jgi:hypothetical protein
LMPSSSAGCAVTAFAGKADIARSFEMSAFNPKRTSQTILVSAFFSFLKAIRLVPQRAIYFAPH